jgi:hypothetical protein
VLSCDGKRALNKVIKTTRYQKDQTEWQDSDIWLKCQFSRKEKATKEQRSEWEE